MGAGNMYGLPYDLFPRGHQRYCNGRSGTVAQEPSGGQVQRVAIARALLGRLEVLILDEATSQIYEATAGKVRAGVQASAPGMTVLEISHQVDRVPEAAHVAVIDEGEVVEQGAKGTLMGQADGYLSCLAAR